MTNGKGAGREVYSALSFLCENYTDDCWYWETVETCRKLVFTLITLYADSESRSYLVVLAAINCLYGVVFASYKPVEDVFEYWLQLTSIMGALANLFVGMMIKVPKDEMASSLNNTLDSIFLTGMVLFANGLVLAVVGGEVCAM